MITVGQTVRSLFFSLKPLEDINWMLFSQLNLYSSDELERTQMERIEIEGLCVFNSEGAGVGSLTLDKIINSNLCNQNKRRHENNV